MNKAMQKHLAALIIAGAVAICPSTTFAISYLPGQALNPACTPQDPTCVVTSPSPTNQAALFIATSSVATSTFAGNTTVSGNASSTNVTVSNTLTIGSLSGILKAVAGVVTTALVNLSSDVTGILGITNGGTGISTPPTYGQVLVGNSGGTYTPTATSSLGITGGSSFGYPFLSNATSTTLTFSNGLLSLASSTIGNGTQAGGLTISGGATTTGNLIVQGTSTSAFTGLASFANGLEIFANGTNDLNFNTKLASPGFPVPTFQPGPAAGTSNLAFDLIPRGAPLDSGNNGNVWQDTCNADLNNTPGIAWVCSHNGVFSNGDVFFGTNTGNGGVARNIRFGDVVSGYSNWIEQPSANFHTVGGVVGGIGSMLSSSLGNTEQSKNLLLNSGQFSLSPWALTNATISSATNEDPFGGTGASTITSTLAAGKLGQNVTISADGQTYTASAYVNAATLSANNSAILLLQFSGGGGTTVTYGVTLGFNSTHSTFTAPTNYGFDRVNVGCETGCASVSDTWYRVWMTAPNLSDTHVLFYVYPSGVVGSTVIAYGAQLEEQSEVTPYIQTGATPVTRSMGALSYMPITIIATTTVGTTTANYLFSVGSGADIGIAKFFGASSGLRIQSNTNSIDLIGDTAYGTSSQNISIHPSGISNALFISTAGKVGVGTTTTYSRLTVWGPDSNATTSAFAVVNNASTTVFAVYDNGNSTYSGSIFQSSDLRLKTNILSLDASSSLTAIEGLNPVSYTRIDQPGGMNLGFIAQQVASIFPALVSTTSATQLTPDGTLTLNYVGLIAPIVKAIQALATEVQTLEQTIAGFARKFTTQELCVGSTCIDQQQLAAILAATGQIGPASGQSSSDSQGINAQAPSTSDVSPVIAINGDNPAILSVGTTYSDLGATITGPMADLNLGIHTFVGNTPIDQASIDTSKPVTYHINYVVTDRNGITATSTRTVIVQAGDAVSALGDTGNSPQAASSTAMSTAQTN